MKPVSRAGSEARLCVNRGDLHRAPTGGFYLIDGLEQSIEGWVKDFGNSSRYNDTDIRPGVGEVTYLDLFVEFDTMYDQMMYSDTGWPVTVHCDHCGIKDDPNGDLDIFDRGIDHVEYAGNICVVCENMYEAERA
jgi:hypothetical protein